MNEDDRVDDEDTACPRCGHFPVLSARCDKLDCNDGWVDLYDEDPIYYSPNEVEMCRECWGTGIVRWCPKCGFDLQAPEGAQDEA